MRQPEGRSETAEGAVTRGQPVVLGPSRPEAASPAVNRSLSSQMEQVSSAACEGGGAAAPSVEVHDEIMTPERSPGPSASILVS